MEIGMVDPDAPADAASAPPVVEAEDVDQDLDDEGELGAAVDGTSLAGADGPEVELEKDDEGCISIDLDDADGDLEHLIEDAAAGVEEAGTAAPAETPPTPARGGSVNLLDELLAEEGEDLLRSSETEQVSTIASEIGRNLGDDQAADPDMQYQQGLVYLEMGLYDQAALAFKAAASDPAHALQACEMWGIALHREGRLAEALDVLQAALGSGDGGGRPVLGLHYQAGRILEELGRGDEAQEHYRQVHAVDAGFADVASRLRAPVG
jgi:tetratricopeptide (TPR) repeat protein